MSGRKPLKLVNKIISLAELGILFSSILLIYLPLASQYITFTRPVGGDYYNAYTYAVHLSKHLPFPPTGWLPFWHEGIPVIGGYAVSIFYLMSPLFLFFTAAQAMELFAAGALLIFLFLSGILFRMITKSLPMAILLTFLVFVTKASFYQLFAEGFITAASMQWTLPATLLALLKYLETHKNKYLVATGLMLGIAILLHPALGGLTVAIPVITWLTVYYLKQKSYKKLIFSWWLLSLLILTISGPALLMLVKFNIHSSGSGACTNSQCWGLYPEHLYLWFHPWAFALFSITFTIVIIIKALKKTISVFPFTAALIAAGTLILYVLLAYFHMIDSLAGGVFPRRLFWAINILLLVSCAFGYRIINRQLSRLFGVFTHFLLSGLILVFIITLYLLRPQFFLFDINSLFNHPGSTPNNVSEHIIPKYQKSELNTLLPEWVISKSNDANYRFDSLNQQVYQWWNAFAANPSTRGYSNSPTGTSANWLYYFQVGTAENSPTTPSELIINRTLFLLDHYAVGLYDDSQRSASGGRLGYDLNILNNKEIMLRSQQIRELNFYELSPKVITPIVSPTNAIPFLIVSDTAGYETIVRAFSYTGITSRDIIPVKGPDSIDRLMPSELQMFPFLFLYRFKGSQWKNIQDYYKNGGILIVELGSLSDLPRLPSFFPVAAFTQIQVNNKLQFHQNDSDLLSDVDTNQFAPFIYEGGPWNIWIPEQLDSSAVPILTTKEGTGFLSKSQEKGGLFISGMNLPFHIVDTQNYAEVKFFKNIFDLLNPNQVKSPVVDLFTRPTPERITIAGQFRGVYFKENYDPGWKARSENQKLKVYPAGPQFMYIPTPNTNKLTIKYQGTVLGWTLFFASITAITASSLYLFLPKRLEKALWSILHPLFGTINKILSQIQTAEHENY